MRLSCQASREITGLLLLSMIFVGAFLPSLTINSSTLSKQPSPIHRLTQPQLSDPAPPASLGEVINVLGFSQPFGVAFNPLNNLTYITNLNGNPFGYPTSQSFYVNVYNGLTPVASIRLEDGATASSIAYNPSNGYVYVAYSVRTGVGNVSVISQTSVIANIPIPSLSYVYGMIYANGYMYLTDFDANVLIRLSGTTLLDTKSIKQPAGLAYDGSNGYVYVASYGSNSVLALNGANQVVANISRISTPLGVAYNPVSKDVYAVSSLSRNVTVITGTSISSFISPLPDAAAPGFDQYTNFIMYNPADSRMYVADGTSGFLTAISGTTPIGIDLHGGCSSNFISQLAYDPVHNYLYAADGFCGMALVRGGVLSARVPSLNDPWGEAYDSSNNRLYVAGGCSGDVSVYAGVDYVTTLHLVASTCSSPSAFLSGIAFDPSNGYVYVADTYSGNITVISGTSVVATVHVAPLNSNSFPLTFGLAYNAFNSNVYAADYSNHTVDVINGVKLLASIPLGGAASPTHVVYDPSNHYMYVTDSGTNQVRVVNGVSLLANLTFVAPPAGLAFNPSDNDMYVSNGNQVSLLSGTSLVNNITGLNSPYNLAYDPSLGYMYVTVTKGVSVINSTKILNTIATSTSPNEIIFNPSNDYLYQSDSQDNIIPIIGIPQTHLVTFNETGLPSGYPWSVKLGTANASSNTPNIRFSEPNGTFPFTIGNTPGFTPSPASGLILVNGTNVNKTITFTQNPSIPGAPRNLAAKAGAGYIFLTWNPPTSNGGSPITSYKVYRGPSLSAVTFLASTPNVTDYNDTGLGAGSTYFYLVTAVNAAGEGTYSNSVNATTASAPSAPQDLFATTGLGGVVLAWLPPASSGSSPILGYKVYRGASMGGEVYLASVGNVTSYTDSSVVGGRRYYYWVTALNGVGEGAPSAEASIDVPSAPSAPQNLVASASGSAIALRWSAPASNGGSSIIGYRVYRGSASGAETLLATLGNVTSYSDTSVSVGVGYYYRVTAVNSAGESTFSNEAYVMFIPYFAWILLGVGVVVVVGVSAWWLRMRRARASGGSAVQK
jgi:YVTN family beta-propeller protein